MSHKRQNSSQNSSQNHQTKPKKIKKLSFTSSDILKTKIKVNDKSASVICYIDEIIQERTFYKKSDNSEFKIFKFIINNNDGIRIQCNMYDDIITKFKSFIKLFETILIENLRVVKTSIFSKGNVPYEFNIQNFSSITTLENFENIQATEPSFINFKDIPVKHGLIKIEGFLKNCLIKKNTSEFFGVITDGIYKLDILLSSNNDLKIDRGKKLIITGDLHESHNTYALKISNEQNIQILDESMDLTDLMNGNETFLITTENSEDKDE